MTKNLFEIVKAVHCIVASSHTKSIYVIKGIMCSQPVVTAKENPHILYHPEAFYFVIMTARLYIYLDYNTAS